MAVVKAGEHYIADTIQMELRRRFGVTFGVGINRDQMRLGMTLSIIVPGHDGQTHHISEHHNEDDSYQSYLTDETIATIMLIYGG